MLPCTRWRLRSRGRRKRHLQAVLQRLGQRRGSRGAIGVQKMPGLPFDGAGQGASWSFARRHHRSESGRRGELQLFAGNEQANIVWDAKTLDAYLADPQKKALQLTDARIRKFGSVDASTSSEIHRAIFKFPPFQRPVIAHHAQEALTHLRERTIPLANSLEQLIATAINLNHAEFREFSHPNMDKLTCTYRVRSRLQ
jgi:hypothetical protein